MAVLLCPHVWVWAHEGGHRGGLSITAPHWLPATAIPPPPAGSCSSHAKCAPRGPERIVIVRWPARLPCCRVLLARRAFACLLARSYVVGRRPPPLLYQWWPHLPLRPHTTRRHARRASPGSPRWCDTRHRRPRQWPADPPCPAPGRSTPAPAQARPCRARRGRAHHHRCAGSPPAGRCCPLAPPACAAQRAARPRSHPPVIHGPPRCRPLPQQTRPQRGRVAGTRSFSMSWAAQRVRRGTVLSPPGRRCGGVQGGPR